MGTEGGQDHEGTSGRAARGLTFAPTTVSIRSALQEESRAAIEALAREMAAPAE